MSRKSGLFILALVCAMLLAQTTVIGQEGSLSYAIETISIEGMPTYDMAVSPDGTMAAVYAGRTTQTMYNLPTVEYEVIPNLLPIRLLDLTSGQELRSLVGATDYANDVAFTPDGKRLVSYHRIGEIIVWDLETQLPVQRITAIMGFASIAILPDGHTLVVHMAGSQIHYFLMWDLDTASITKVWHNPKYTAFGDFKLMGIPQQFDNLYAAFDVSPDGAWMATANANADVELWNMATLRPITLQKQTEESGGRFNVRTVRFSDDGQTLVYYDLGTETTHFWDVATQTEVGTLPIGERYFALSPQNDVLAYGNREELWLVPVDQPERATLVAGDAITSVTGAIPDKLRIPFPVMQFMPDGRHLIVGGIGTGEEYTDGLIMIVTLAM